MFFLTNPGFDIPTAIYERMKKKMKPKTMIFHAAPKAFYDWKNINSKIIEMIKTEGMKT